MNFKFGRKYNQYDCSNLNFNGHIFGAVGQSGVSGVSGVSGQAGVPGYIDYNRPVPAPPAEPQPTNPRSPEHTSQFISIMNNLIDMYDTLF